jgi:hypothetical protein
MRVRLVISVISKWTGLRYLFDFGLDAASAVVKVLPSHFSLRQSVESIEWWYTIQQTHRRRCPECTWMIGVWPFNRSHKYCDIELAKSHNGITGPHSIATSYCECGSPLTARIIRKKTHACEWHMENLHVLPLRTRIWRSLINA